MLSISWKMVLVILVPVVIAVLFAKLYHEINKGSPGNVDSVKFCFYHGSSETFKVIELDKPATIPSGFSKKKSLTLWIHGFGDNPDMKNFGSAIVEAYSNSTTLNTNFVAVDWTELSRGWEEENLWNFFLIYFRSARWNVPVVADKIAAFISWLEKQGLAEGNKTHIIGFSLGGHLAGHSASVYQKNNDGKKISRVTGLDPVGLGFEFPPVGVHMLGKDDAEFVDVLHTNIFFQGVISPIGHVDVYVNNAVTQPGCPPINSGLLEWSNYPHSFAIRLYAKSVSTELTGSRVTLCRLFPICGPSPEEKTAVGYSCPSTSRGVYHIWTDNVQI